MTTDVDELVFEIANDIDNKPNETLSSDEVRIIEKTLNSLKEKGYLKNE